MLKFIQQRKEARNSNAIPLQQAGKEAGNSNVDPLIVLTPSVLLRPPTPALGASSAAPKKKKEPKKGSWDQKKKEMVFAELIQQNVANAEHGKAGPLMDTVVLNLANNPLFKYHPKNLLTVPNVLQMVCKEVKRVEMGVIDPARNAHSAEDWTELDNRVSKYAEAKRDKKEKRAAQRDKDAQLQEKLMFFEDNLGFGTEDKDDDMPDLVDEEGTDDMPDLMEQPDGSSGGGSSLSFYNGWAPRHLGFSTTSPASSSSSSSSSSSLSSAEHPTSAFSSSPLEIVKVTVTPRAPCKPPRAAEGSVKLPAPPRTFDSEKKKKARSSALQAAADDNDLSGVMSMVTQAAKDRREERETAREDAQEERRQRKAMWDGTVQREIEHNKMMCELMQQNKELLERMFDK